MAKPKQIQNESIGHMLINDIDHMLEARDPRDMRKTVLEMFFTYLITQHNFLPYDMDKFAGCTYELIGFLEKAAEKRKVS